MLETRVPIGTSEPVYHKNAKICRGPFRCDSLYPITHDAIKAGFWIAILLPFSVYPSTDNNAMNYGTFRDEWDL